MKDIDKTDDDAGGDEDEGWDGIIRRAVIGVPANCSEKKKEATRRAARTAGFEEVRSATLLSVIFSNRVIIYVTVYVR